MKEKSLYFDWDICGSKFYERIISIYNCDQLKLMGWFQNRIGCFIKKKKFLLFHLVNFYPIWVQFGSNLGLNNLKFVQNHKYGVKTQVLQVILEKNMLFLCKICLYFFIYFLIMSSVKIIVLRSGQEIILCAWKAVLNFTL